jgi:hypothetical protein
MLPDQETTLEAAVLEELVRIASVKLAIPLENESRILNDKRAVGLPHKNHSVKSIFWKKGLRVWVKTLASGTELLLSISWI